MRKNASGVTTLYAHRCRRYKKQGFDGGGGGGEGGNVSLWHHGYLVVYW